MDSDEPDWHLQEWAALKGKRQAGLVNEIGWTKNTAHRIWHSKQPYRRDIVNALAKWLEIQPFELLMRPHEAVAMQRFRESAALIAGEPDAPPFDHGDHAGPSTKARR
jgi:hypothetical protein